MLFQIGSARGQPEESSRCSTGHCCIVPGFMGARGRTDALGIVVVLEQLASVFVAWAVS